MKTKSIISILFLLIVSILYFFGFCEWDLPVYLICVVVTAVFTYIFYRQEKTYQSLENEKRQIEENLRRNTAD